MARFNRVFATWLLTGETMLAWDIDYAVGTTSGDAYEYTRLNSAAFLRPDGSDEIELARRSISGVLLCGLGSETPRLIGVLNPGPSARSMRLLFRKYRLVRSRLTRGLVKFVSRGRAVTNNEHCEADDHRAWP